MATLGLILTTLGGLGVIAARLLFLRWHGTLSWEREIPIIVTFPLVVVSLVVVSQLDDEVARTGPLLSGAVMTLVLGSLGAYALWLGRRYDSAAQRVLGTASLVLAAVATVLTLVAAIR